MAQKVFAVGLGFKQDPIVRYVKAFTHREDNDGPVQDFLKIVSENFHYEGGNVVLSLEGIDLKNLQQVFINNNHQGSADFIDSAKGRESNAVICIMVSNDPPTNAEESYLILELFSAGTLSALDPEQRNPLTKVFAGLATIPLSAGGVPKKHMEAFDKFSSYLLFKEPGTNRFAPTSFVRYGACLGSGNTWMFGATGNFGISVGDDNLFDGHCSIASCVQVGSRNKIGSFVSMEGVLSPVNDQPVVVGNDNFFGTRCRVGTGLIIGDKNFWGSGVDVSKGTPLKDLRKNSPTYGKYVKASSEQGIQSANGMMITVNRSVREVGDIQVYPGEYLLTFNTEENQARFERNDDLNANN